MSTARRASTSQCERSNAAQESGHRKRPAAKEDADGVIVQQGERRILVTREREVRRRPIHLAAQFEESCRDLVELDISIRIVRLQLVTEQVTEEIVVPRKRDPGGAEVLHDERCFEQLGAGRSEQHRGQQDP